MSIVLNPKVKRKAINISIKDIPVTMSAFSIGTFVTPIIIFLGNFFIFRIAIAAMVPSTVAIKADKNAIISVFFKACKMASS